jgi:DNA-binding LacI/PurR family transcriptional regulator
MAVTMKEIARIAGVSQQAVSAAFNMKGTTKLSEERRQRILQIAKNLNYTPNSAAQRLKGGATKMIGVFGVSYVSVLQQSLLLDFSLILDKKGYSLITCYGRSEKAAARAVNEMIAKGIDGLIITTVENPLDNSTVPAIPHVFCPPGRAPKFDITVDRFSGAFEATEKLIAQGCRKFGFMLPAVSNISVQPDCEKREGVEAALRLHGLTLPDEAVIEIREYCGMASEMIHQIQKLKLDAILCSNDYVGSCLVSLLLRNGIRVPEDIKVTGFDGLLICDLCPVPLATVIQPNQLLAQKAVEILLERIQHKTVKDPPRGISLKPYFYPSVSAGFENSRLENINFISDTYSTLELNWNLNKTP